MTRKLPQPGQRDALCLSEASSVFSAPAQPGSPAIATAFQAALIFSGFQQGLSFSEGAVVTANEIRYGDQYVGAEGTVDWALGGTGWPLKRQN